MQRSSAGTDLVGGVVYRVSVFAFPLCFFAQNVKLLTVVQHLKQVWLVFSGAVLRLRPRLDRIGFHLFLAHGWQACAACVPTIAQVALYRLQNCCLVMPALGNDRNAGNS